MSNSYVQRPNKVNIKCFRADLNQNLGEVHALQWPEKSLKRIHVSNRVNMGYTCTIKGKEIDKKI